MANPILQMLNKPQNSMSNLIQMVKGNPQAVYDQLIQTNPQFSQFVRENHGKPMEQIAQEHGINPSMLNQFKR